MSKQLLQVKHLTVDVEQKEILHGIDLNINAGETHVLMGPNGAGKSTLGYTLMGNPKYHVTGGEILFQGKDITDEAADKRAKEGIFLSFQNPVEVPRHHPGQLHPQRPGAAARQAPAPERVPKGAQRRHGHFADGPFLRRP